MTNKKGYNLIFSNNKWGVGYKDYTPIKTSLAEIFNK